MADEEIDEQLLCRPDEKARLENRNADDQHMMLADLVDRGVTELRESHVRELKALAIRDIFPCGDNYRTFMQKVLISNSEHTLPEAALVRTHVLDALEFINQERTKRSALERAAYALWRFNWIHPFAGGNGRTSRALAYLILCIDNRAMLPGVPTMPSLIYESRDRYILALRCVDAAARLRPGEEPRSEDLAEMTAFLQEMVTQQLASAIEALSNPRRSTT